MDAFKRKALNSSLITPEQKKGNLTIRSLSEVDQNFIHKRIHALFTEKSLSRSTVWFEVFGPDAEEMGDALKQTDQAMKVAAIDAFLIKHLKSKVKLKLKKGRTN